MADTRRFKFPDEPSENDFPGFTPEDVGRKYAEVCVAVSWCESVVFKKKADGKCLWDWLMEDMARKGQEPPGSRADQVRDVITAVYRGKLYMPALETLMALCLVQMHHPAFDRYVRDRFAAMGG